MSVTTEREILDRLYTALGEARKWTALLSSPERLTMLLEKTDYEYLYDYLELIEGCARQMNAWREDTRWLEVSRMVGMILVQIRSWVTMEGLPTFVALIDFLNRTEIACRELETKRTGIRGAILPEEIKPNGSHVPPGLVAVKALPQATNKAPSLIQ